MARLALLMLGVAVALAAPVPPGGPVTAVPQQAGQLTRNAPGPACRVTCGDPGGSGQAIARVLVQTDDEQAVRLLVTALGGRTGRHLPGVPAVVAELPHASVGRLEADPAVRAVNGDRPLAGALEVTSSAIGARWVHESLAFDGAGIGVAIIDSGVAAFHDDLAPGRVVHFADFVGVRTTPYDGYGHGTHVAGIIAGSGAASAGARRGMAPGAHLVVLKALDDHGHGYISTAIAAIDYAIEHRVRYNIRVINLSVAAGVYESYRTDPLTLAARRAVDAGIVVVTAAGNLGQHADGQVQYGGITAPGNAPWVLTVGAASHNGTEDRSDDTVAPFSSRGPSAIDMVAKPDLVAPGVGIESLAEPGSTLFAARPGARLGAAASPGHQPYLSLSGTSMAAPVVAGTVALVLQANPNLTPQGVKAVLQATAEPDDAGSQLAEGAGFLDARAAVELALGFVHNPAATEALGGLLAATPDAYHAWPSGAPPAAPDTFDALAGALAGTTGPTADRLVWREAGLRARRAE